MPLPDRELKSVLVPIPQAALQDAWPLVENWIANACRSSRGRFEAEDVFADLYAKRKQLWVAARDGVIEACMVTEIANYPRARVCVINICVGHDRAHWKRLLPEVEEWARMQRCTKIESVARKGWARALEKDDWEMSHIFIEKELY